MQDRSPSTMACCLVLMLAFLLQISPSSSTVLVAPVIASGPQYVVKISVGTPPQTELLVLDMDSDYTLLKCGHHAGFQPAASSTFRYVPCHGSSCPVSGQFAADSLTFNTTNGRTEVTPLAVPRVKFACVAEGSPTKVTGVAALSSGQWALPAQLAKQGGLARKFAYCLSSSRSHPGPIFFGSGVDYIFQSGPRFSGLPSYATLVEQNKGFALGLQGITVGGTNLKIQPTQLHLSSVQPYTKFTSSIYKTLRSTFRAKAALRNIAAAPAVAPFDTCFRASSIYSTRLGLAVPEIDLQLQGNVTWQIFGLNSVVSVSHSVVCLAFLDAGSSQPSVLGTFQQRDNLIEFDLDKSRLGFSGVLDAYRTDCANFHF